MTYAEFRTQNIQRAVAMANKIYGYKTLDLTNYETHVREYANEILMSWWIKYVTQD